MANTETNTASQQAINSSNIPNSPQDPQLKEEFVFSESHHSTHLMKGLSKLRDCNEFFDVMLIADDRDFPAHRLVLASCSNYFYAMFTGKMKESSQHSIILHGISATALELLLQFMYTSEIRITFDNVVEVLYGASQLQMMSVVQACASYMACHIGLHNCVELEKITDMFSLSEQRSQVLCFICRHWESFMMMPEFLELSLEQLKNILQSDYPVYCAELLVVKALFAWLNHKLPERTCCLSEVLNLVRCDNLWPPDLAELMGNTDVQQVLAMCPSLHTLLSEMVSHCTRHVPGLANTRGHFETLLLVGGYCQGDRKDISNSVRYLDFSTRDFVQYTSIPKMKQANFGLEVLENRLYVVGGTFDEDFTDQTHPYGCYLDLRTNQWSSLFPMLQERSRFYLGALKGKLYAVGGEVDNVQSLSACEVLDPQTMKWSSIASLPCSRTDLAGSSLEGKLYVSGGVGRSISDVRDDLWCYDPDHDCWKLCAPMLVGRADHTMFSFRGYIYAIGGYTWIGITPCSVSEIDQYCMLQNRWVTIQQSKQIRRYCTYTVLQDMLYVVGGEDMQDLQRVKAVDVLDLSTMEWRPGSLELPAVWEHSTVAMHIPRLASAPLR